MSIEGRIQKLEKDIEKKRNQIVELKKSTAKTVDNYELQNWDGGTTRLLELFGNHDDLIVVHNMGKSCPYCTMWADGLNGLKDHLENRAAFAVVSPDPAEEQKAFAESRGWGFTMLSGASGSFIEDMGFQQGNSFMPGFSVFHRHGDTISRISSDFFGPGDFYNAGFHMFDLLKEGQAGWEPAFSYQA